MTSIADFTLDGYRNLLRAFDAHGYALRFFHDADARQPHLVMRHDIDYCLDYALPLADVETEEGMRSSYFVLMNSEFYNPSTPNSVRILKRLLDNGHEIGLHFDASQYAQEPEVLDRACARECAVLEELIERPVKSVSFHRPAQALINRDGPLGGRVHAYQSKFFKEMGYCADSQGFFRYGHPLDHESFARKVAMQIVTHPVWWYRIEREEPLERLKRVLADKAAVMSEHMVENSIPYKNYLQGSGA